MTIIPKGFFGPKSNAGHHPASTRPRVKQVGAASCLQAGGKSFIFSFNPVLIKCSLVTTIYDVWVEGVEDIDDYGIREHSGEDLAAAHLPVI